MLRQVLPVISAAIVTALITHLVMTQRSENVGSLSRRAPNTHIESLKGIATTTAHAALLASVQALRDSVTCERTLVEVEAQPGSYTRDLRIELLVRRCAELDAPRAIAHVDELELGQRYLVAAFRAWAISDTEGALASLARRDSIADRRAAAAALIEVVGGDEAAILRIASAVPGADATSLRIEALIAEAKRNPVKALKSALALSDATARDLALPQIAALWSEKNPRTALAATPTFDDPLAAADFEARVLTEWATNDVSAFLTYADANGVFQSGIVPIPGTYRHALQIAATLDPDALLTIAEGSDEQWAQLLRSLALRALVLLDPREALAKLGTLPERERQGLLSTLANAYASVDSGAALAWARSLQPPSPDAVRAVEVVLSANDTSDRTNPLGTSRVSRMLPTGADFSDAGAPRSGLLIQWAREDDIAVFEWLKENSLSLAEQDLLFRHLAQGFASKDFDHAIRMADDLPDGMRDAWLTHVNAIRTGRDPNALVTVFTRAVAEPNSANSLAAYRAASENPQASLALLGTIADEQTRRTIVTLSLLEWTDANPNEAARWAADFDDPVLRVPAVRAVAARWASADLDSADRWVRTLPDAAARDSGLEGLILSMVRVNRIDDAFIARFSSNAAAQGSIARMLPSIARLNPEQVTPLSDRYVTDPAVRATVQLEVERAGTMPLGGPSTRPAPLAQPRR